MALLDLSRVRSTALRCPSRACRLRARSLVRPRDLVTLRPLSSRLPPGSMVLRRDPGTLLRLSRAVRLRDHSLVLPRGLVMLPRLSSKLPVGSTVLPRLSRVVRLPVGSTVLPRPRATPPNLSWKITLTRPRIAMPSPSRRLILSPASPRLLRLTMLVFLNPLVR